MRLICPNCGAQYEVDDSVIPDSGRDVQCSDCGTAWFQKSAAATAAETEARRIAVVAAASKGTAMEWAETSRLAGDTEEATPAPPPEESASAGPAEIEAEVVAEAEPTPPVAPEVPEEVAPELEPEPQVVFKRRAIDETTLNVLREEAEREAKARREEQGGALQRPAVSEPEASGERSLQARAMPDAAAVAQPAPAAVATPAPAPAPAAAPAEDDRHSRKELLPDIEQIKSTLRSTSDRDGDAASRDAPEYQRRQRASFRTGFVMAIVMIAALFALYAMAPEIVSAMPGTEGLMAAYVGTVDGLRLWLQNVTLAAAEAMGGPGL
ncbi:zinc-ribbon domain-containing protein [Albidovulum sediminis]|nr:zinc-ribbon domain-containing protein [Defluviimonas sediminis]